MREIWATLMVRYWARRGIRAATLARKCKAKQATWSEWLWTLRGGK